MTTPNVIRRKGPHIRKNPTIKPGVRKLTEEQVDKLIHIQARTSKRRALMLRVLYSSGCRISEVLTLVPENVEVDNSRIYVPCLKWERIEDEDNPNGVHEWDWVTLDPPVAKALGEFIHRWRIPRGELIFPWSRQNCYYHVRKVGEEAHIEGVHPHLLRHSLATNLLAGEVPLRVVSKQLKHRSVRTTEDLYFRPSTDDTLKERAKYVERKKGEGGSEGGSEEG